MQFSESKKHPGGSPSQEGGFADGSVYSLLPPILQFRPLAKELGGIDLSGWRLVDRPASLDGHSCRILERSREDGAVEHLWIEETPGYPLCRKQALSKGRVFGDLAMSYHQNGDKDPICTSWKYVSRSGSKISQVCATQDAVVRVNVELPESDFQLIFPPGTLVTLKGGYAIARDDGSLRPVSRGELSAGVSYETLMSTDPPPEAVAAIQQLQPGRSSIFWAAVFAFCLTLAYALRRRIALLKLFH
jgi:hypothetical protein